MLNLSVLQDQEILLALGAGVVMTLMIVLAYMEIWRPRREETDEVPRQNLVVWFLSYVPWIVVLIAAGGGIWGLLYAIDKIVHPPNW